MSNAIPITSDREQVEVCRQVATVAVPIGKSGSWLVAGCSAILGVWGCVCLVSGLFNCTSAAAFKQALVMMLTGM
ncbi:MAG: hypothetical protein AB1568_06065 [Thermodesulfobacteriota bacterium]